MPADHFFRWFLVAAFATVMPLALRYRLRARVPGERLDRWQEGKFILFSLRPVAFVGLVSLIAYIVNPASMAWASLPLPTWLRWFGVALGTCAGSLLLWTFHTLGRNLTDTVVTRRDAHLVTHGPYRWVRHPFYTSFAMAVLANGLISANWFIFLTGAIAFSLIVLRTRREEANLIARFGDDYRAYMRRTGRFIPFV